MKTEVERLPEGRVELRVEVDPPAVEEALDQAYRHLARTLVLPGFRRGRAPRSIVERMLGRERLWRDAVDPLVQRSFDQAATELGLEPVESPQVDFDTIPDAGEPFAYKAVFTNKPEVTLGDYRAIRIPPEAAPVTDADVDQALTELRQSRARWVPEEEAAAADGMMVTVDVTGTVDGLPVPAESGVSGVLGEGNLRPAIEDGVRGMRPGEQREVEISFPPEDADASLAGKTGRFTVSLIELKKKQVPELDPEFAREVSEGSTTVEELRAEVQKTLARVAASRAEDAVGAAARQRAVDEATVEVPSVMVERQLDSMLRDMDRQLERAGGSLAGYLEQQGRQLEDMRAEMRGDAERQVKTQLVLDAIATREGLTASPDEVRREIEDMASQYGPSAGQVRRLLQRPENLADVRAELRLSKAARFLRELALRGDDAAGSGAGAAASGPADGDVGSAQGDAETGAAASAPAEAPAQAAEAPKAGPGGSARRQSARAADPAVAAEAAESAAAGEPPGAAGRSGRGSRGTGTRQRSAAARRGPEPDPEPEAEAGAGAGPQPEDQPEDRAEANA